jgi:hypothetical protein
MRAIDAEFRAMPGIDADRAGSDLQGQGAIHPGIVGDASTWTIACSMACRGSRLG